METITEYFQSKGHKAKPIGEDCYELETCPFCFHHDCFRSKDEMWKCFSCNKAGDKFKFESLVEGISYQEAKERLTGNIINLPSPDYDQMLQNHKRLLSSEHLKWLTQERKISLLAIKKHKLGVFENEQGNPVYCFPYLDERGQVKNTKFRQSDSKKMFFKKGGDLFLFGTHLVKDSTRITLVEGEIDSCSFTSLNLSIPAVSVGLGALNWKDQWLEYFNKFEEIFIMFDADEVGQKGSRFFAEKIGKDKCKLVKQVEGFKDLNEFLVKGSGESQEIEIAIQNAMSLDQVEIFNAIDAVPLDAKLGSVIGNILSNIAERPETEIDDYLSYIKERFKTPHSQVTTFRRQVKILQKEIKNKNIQENNNKKKEYEMSEEEKKEALNILEKDDSLDTVAHYFSALGLVGEKENAIVCFLSSITRLMAEQSHILINGVASSGKSAIQSLIASVTPEESLLSISSSSARAFDYMEEEALDRKLITIMELDGIANNPDALLNLRLLQSEGAINRLSVGKNLDTGEMTTSNNSKSVKSSFLITTNLPPSSLDSQNLSRCWVLFSNESLAQNFEVRDSILFQQTKKWKEKDQKRENIKTLIKNTQRLLDPDILVSIEYAPLLRFPAQSASSRRALKLFLNILKAVAFFRQKTKKIHVDGLSKWIECDVTDYAYVYKYLHKILSASLSDLSERARNVLKVCCSLEHQKKIKKSKDTNFSFNEIQEKAKELGVDLVNKDNAREQLYHLIEEEYLLVTDGIVGQRGRKLYFKVGIPYSIDETTGEVKELMLLNNEIMTADELKDALSDSAQTWN